MKKNLEFQEALDLILAHINPLEPENVELSGLYNRYAAEDITARIDLPPFNNSAMDGFAVQSIDIKLASRENPVILRIAEDIYAGDTPHDELAPGSAVKIMTGAPVPPGADAVVKKEDTEIAGNTVKIYMSAREHQNIRFSGEDIARGDTCIRKGDFFDPARVAMLAAQNITNAAVYRKPTVALLATGNEILRPGEESKPGMIYSSNSFALTGMIMDCHATVLDFGIARDNEDELESKIQDCMGQDVVITTGGVSVGDRDLVISILEKIGVEILFWKSKVKPGKPVVFGTHKNTVVFGLPGNAVSSMVSFELFVRPALLKLQGAKRILRQTIQTIMEAGFNSRGDRREFVRAVTRYENGKFYSSLTGPQGSGMLHSMIRGNSLVIVPGEKKQIKQGDVLPCLLFELPLISHKSI